MPGKKQILVILFYFALAYFIYVYRIQGPIYSVILVIGCIVYIFAQAGKKKKCDDRGQSCNECILGNRKSYVGFLDGGCLDVWHIYHIQMWGIIGMLSPGYIEWVTVIAILWETIEHFVFKYECKKQPIFCGRVEDVIFNVVGYWIGENVMKIKNHLS